MMYNPKFQSQARFGYTGTRTKFAFYVQLLDGCINMGDTIQGSHKNVLRLARGLFMLMLSILLTLFSFKSLVVYFAFVVSLVRMFSISFSFHCLFVFVYRSPSFGLLALSLLLSIYLSLYLSIYISFLFLGSLFSVSYFSCHS